MVAEVPKSIDSLLNVDFVTGRFDPSTHEQFVLISQKYASREGLYLQRDTYEAFQKMWQKASDDGVTLVIKSATRNFDYQKGIWERKWNGSTILSDGVNAASIEDEEKRALKILLYSSMPGTSRHHWGTDIDLNSFNNGWFETGDGLEVYNWLKDNAFKYGFCQVYSEKGQYRPFGYEEEKWHWSYLPISEYLTKYVGENLDYKAIKGFEGADVAMKIDVINKYILGINPNCKL